MKLSIGVIIGICLIIYWYMHDHPRVQPQPPTTQSYNFVVTEGAA